MVLDSRVAVGAIGKGRSPSVGLNSALPIFLRVHVLFGLTATRRFLSQSLARMPPRLSSSVTVMRVCERM